MIFLEKIMFHPGKTVELLNDLEKLGFNDEQLRIIHRKPSDGYLETIESHRNYCRNTTTFVSNSRNEIVCKRLNFIAKHKDCIENLESFTILAKIAANEFPFVAS
jgi:hypothetical protein